MNDENNTLKNVLEITSLQNPRVKQLNKFRKRSVREEDQVVLIEGYRELTRALEQGWPLTEVYFCTELFLGDNEMEVLQAAETEGAQLLQCSEAVFRKIAYRDRPDGLLAVAPQHHMTLDDLPEMDNPFLLLMVGIEKPGNLGTMLRSADGAGVDAVIICDPVTDIFNPNTVRASVGTLFSVPVAESTYEECTAWLKEQGIPMLAATPHAERSLYETDLSGPVALAVGSEMHGLDDRWMNAADLQVSLPMCGIADSLNVSTAAALILYETLRQRMKSE
ncbi:MAG: RNA methyltransferase [Verrucomicrobia bacterium]|nr:RNA methyltransferase [Verrucomicrobiota bacterium]MCH8510031.1 RNA methyltransferase [Kiritimatiellia bacterium]